MNNIVKKVACAMLLVAVVMSCNCERIMAMDLDTNCEINKNILFNYTNEKKVLNDYQKEFDQMDKKELNQYIDNTIKEINAKSTYGTNSIFGDQKLKAVQNDNILLKSLWLAAAKIAKTKYPCAAKLVECSVYGKNYDEFTSINDGNGLFKVKLKNNVKYKKFINSIKKKKKAVNKIYTIRHEKEENADLYYALHECTYEAYKIKKEYKLIVRDRFNFSLTDYKDAFTGLVNNWAWLCQHSDILNDIGVKIEITEIS